jgi:hypothetical protein
MRSGQLITTIRKDEEKAEAYVLLAAFTNWQPHRYYPARCCNCYATTQRCSSVTGYRRRLRKWGNFITLVLESSFVSRSLFRLCLSRSLSLSLSLSLSPLSPSFTRALSLLLSSLSPYRFVLFLKVGPIFAHCCFMHIKFRE